MTVIPDYGFADAPDPDVVVVGPNREMTSSVRGCGKSTRSTRLIMSVCEGAFKLAQAGLLDDKSADDSSRRPPAPCQPISRIAVHSSVRYVQSDPLILTAGGLSSGIDSALHVVELYYGPKVAQAAADDMEYQGQGGRPNAGTDSRTQVQATIPLAYRDRETLWQGMFHRLIPSPSRSCHWSYILPG